MKLLVNNTGWWWYLPVIPVLEGRSRWISEVKASLGYRPSSRAAWTTWRNPVSKSTLPTPIKRRHKDIFTALGEQEVVGRTVGFSWVQSLYC